MFPSSTAKRTLQVHQNSFDRVPRTRAQFCTACYPIHSKEGKTRERKKEKDMAGRAAALRRCGYIFYKTFLIPRRITRGTREGWCAGRSLDKEQATNGKEGVGGKASLNISWNKEKCDSTEARPQHFCLYKIMYSAGLRHISQSITSSLCVSLASPHPPSLQLTPLDPRPLFLPSSLFSTTTHEIPPSFFHLPQLVCSFYQPLSSSFSGRVLVDLLVPSAHTPTARRATSFRRSTSIVFLRRKVRTNASHSYRNRISCGRRSSTVG